MRTKDDTDPGARLRVWACITNDGDHRPCVVATFSSAYLAKAWCESRPDGGDDYRIEQMDLVVAYESEVVAYNLLDAIRRNKSLREQIRRAIGDEAP